MPADHPLRPIRRIVDAALARLTGEFEALYTDFGRPSIPPEQLLRALLLQVLYTVRSERLLIEQLEYNLLFRWFVGFGLDERIWNHSTFSKNRERLLRGAIAEAFFAQVLDEARTHGLLSDEHFTVDGTLLEAWASHKSFRPKDEDSSAPPDDPKNPTVNFRGRTAEERHAPVDHGSGRPDVSQERRASGAAGVHGPRADGEPVRPDRRYATSRRPMATANAYAALLNARGAARPERTS